MTLLPRRFRRVLLVSPGFEFRFCTDPCLSLAISRRLRTKPLRRVSGAPSQAQNIVDLLVVKTSESCGMMMQDVHYKTGRCDAIDNVDGWVDSTAMVGDIAADVFA